jgi:hypothetical protein
MVIPRPLDLFSAADGLPDVRVGVEAGEELLRRCAGAQVSGSKETGGGRNRPMPHRRRVSPKRPLTLCLPNSAFDAAPGMSTGCPGADVTGAF